MKLSDYVYLIDETRWRISWLQQVNAYIFTQKIVTFLALYLFRRKNDVIKTKAQSAYDFIFYCKSS